MRFLRDESGQAAVMVAMCLVVLLGMMALAIDVGQLRYEKQKLQMAADAAALAGALELTACAGTSNCAALETAAQDGLTENGFTGSTLLADCATGSGTGLTISVNNGPCALGSQDPYSGDSNYVEVVVSETQPTYFAGILGINSVPIKTRAEAALGNSPFCFYIMGSTGTTLQINGGSLTLQCGIMDDSSSSVAFQANGGTISATAINIHGGDQINGTVINATTSTYVAALADPLISSSIPSIQSCGVTTLSPFSGSPRMAEVNGSASATFNPGTYCGGIQLNGSGTNTFEPGTYVLTGAMQVNGGTLTGNGVTFYLQSGSIQFNGANHIDLVAPTTGTYAGILFFQNPSDASTAQLNGDVSSVFQGALYFPGALLQLNGGNLAAYTIVDAKQIRMNGSGFSLNDDYSSLPGGSPAKNTSAVLVE